MAEIKPVRLQLSRRKGFDLQAISLATNGLTAVAVTRGPGRKWGNPYRIGTAFIPDAQAATQAFAANLPMSADYSALRGKNLACSCPLPDLGQVDWCHAAVLIREANRPTCERITDPEKTDG